MKKPPNKAKSASEKKDRPKRRLLLVIPLVLLIAVVTVAALAITGKIKLPFLAQKASSKKVVSKKAPPKKVIAAPPAPVAVRVPIQTPPVVAITTKKVLPTIDPDRGARKLAQLWDGMEADALNKVIANWREPELAKVFAKMDADKVAEVLSAMPPQKASAVSRAIQKETSRIAPIKS